jgi:PAS domain S-box-containing protein
MSRRWRVREFVASNTDDPYRLLVQSILDYAIYMLDTRGHVTSWNPGAERIKGYSAEEIIGQHFSRFYTEEDRTSGVPKRALETAAREGKFESEAWRVRKDGSRFWASVVIDSIRDEKGELIGFAKITRDMTEKREAEQGLNELREQLYRSQKMEALGQLTGGLAHDFNNLLTAILGASDLALRSVDNPKKLNRMIDGIRSSAQRGASLTKQLLAFARAQPLEIKSLDVPKFMSDMTTLLRPSLRSNVQLSIEIADQLWNVDTDAGALELALLNLAFNARDAMKSGGTLKLSASNVVLEGDPDGLRGEHVALRVTDNGTGMDPDTVERIFEPFFTTKGYGEGTGLGLSQVFGFAKQIGGAVSVHSELGKGSEFTLYLPASHGAATKDKKAEDSGKLPLGRVLVVEDDDVVAELAAGLLQELGFEATVVHSAREALERLTRGDRPKLIFTDIVMPGGISGIELARKVRSRFPELPILLTTGYSEQVRDAHGFPVLQKPYELESLVGALRELLREDIRLS